mmetsp:Transcript_1074/g.2117  ORF Transcript_1074/g.2117 Transcript_1074/m.2117 type:complete len:94 (-) Transcript_1074:175-456(-)
MKSARTRQIKYLFVSAAFTIRLEMPVCMDCIQEEHILINQPSSFRLLQGYDEHCLLQSIVCNVSSRDIPGVPPSTSEGQSINRFIWVFGGTLP